MQADLFAVQQDLPNGLSYLPDFITAAEERALLAAVRPLEFREARYKSHTARRRVVRFGSELMLEAGDEESDFPRILFPPFLAVLRERVARWLSLPPEQFEHGLVTEYRPGAPLGWHRDAPHFEIIAGVSLADPCDMRFRPFDARSPRDTLTLSLAPRSAYVMRGDIRWRWQHSIAPVKSLRYSITLRTLADGALQRKAG
jgi:alkylated DNA repair dioxygenase AlkB